MEALNLHTDLNTQITNIVSSIGNHDQLNESEYQSLPLYQNICTLTANMQQLVFILPAFPAKSASPEKTSGVHADLGEVLALHSLEKMCKRINQIYLPGAKVVICSDGRVFNDLVMVSDEDLLTYKYDLIRIFEEFSLKNIQFFDLDDCFEDAFEVMRSKLVEDFGKSVEDIRAEVRADKNTQNMFNRLHRFLKDDISVLKNELSKNQQNKLLKELAYKVILRSRSWDHMLAKKFPNTLRLSIPPYGLILNGVIDKEYRGQNRSRDLIEMNHSIATALGIKKMIFWSIYPALLCYCDETYKYKIITLKMKCSI